MDCLDNIVGLSRKDCECFTDGRPGTWNESKSGLFLDELSGLTQKGIDSSTDCGEGSIWDIMSKALMNGENKFRTDLLSNLNQVYKDRFPAFTGVIGLRKFNGVAPDLDDLLGIRIESNCIKGSCFVLKSIDAYFDTTIAALEINIYRTGEEIPLHTFDIATEAFMNKTTVLPTPIELPLYVDGLEDFSYSIVYNLPAGVKPLNTKLYTCSCSRNKSAWSLWVTVDGIKAPGFTTTLDLEDLGGTSYTYGLNLVSEIRCKKGNIICEDGKNWDFKNDDIALQIANAIREASGIILLQDILTRPDSAYFALNEEQIQQLIIKYSMEYNDRIQYLSLNIKPNNDCFVCSDQMQGVGILA